MENPNERRKMGKPLLKAGKPMTMRIEIPTASRSLSEKRIGRETEMGVFEVDLRSMDLTPSPTLPGVMERERPVKKITKLFFLSREIPRRWRKYSQRT